jgi:putative ubiquitin-RnfH superfamily antitoxin RatB of RatAB toxin-antitoxin module
LNSPTPTVSRRTAQTPAIAEPDEILLLLVVPAAVVSLRLAASAVVASVVVVSVVLEVVVPVDLVGLKVGVIVGLSG